VQFKKEFENARDNNTKLASNATATEDKPEVTGESKDEEPNPPATEETNPPATGADEKTGEE